MTRKPRADDASEPTDWRNIALRRWIPITQVKVTDTFWRERMDVVREVVIPYQEDILHDRIEEQEPSYAIRNFRIAAGLEDGEYYGMVFQDSDVAKWLEAAAYSLAVHPDADLESRVEEVIAVIEQAQQEDGYLNTFYTVKEPGKRWTNLRENHELYCAGHMMEAAVAYYEAVGKTTLLDVMCRMADHIDTQFGPEPEKRQGYPGHEEIELALVKLYRVTNEERYLRLAEYFIQQRGQEPHYFEEEARKRGEEDVKVTHGLWDYSYSQSHRPVLEQSTAEGHAVRAVYLYSGMVDVAVETNNEELLKVCQTLWQNVTKQRMYITGGIGSQSFGEAFTIDYDLPNDTAYTETCAAIGLIFWAKRMLQADLNGSYGDVMERALYNNVLSGISWDGKQFFYVNPLEVRPDVAEYRNDHRHVMTERQGWFGCACCPPNVARLLASLGQYIYSHDDEQITVDLFVGSEADFKVQGQDVRLHQETNYPWDAAVTLRLALESSVKFELAVRIPSWCRRPELSVNGEAVDLSQVMNNGYAALERTWEDDDIVELQLPMQPERVYAHPSVGENSGRTALMRGPVVYCLEEVDNGSQLRDIQCPGDAAVTESSDAHQWPWAVCLAFNGFRTVFPEQALYAMGQLEYESVSVVAVPYFLWGNRGRGEMLVWLREC